MEFDRMVLELIVAAIFISAQHSQYSMIMEIGVCEEAARSRGPLKTSNRPERQRMQATATLFDLKYSGQPKATPKCNTFGLDWKIFLKRGRATTLSFPRNRRYSIISVAERHRLEQATHL